MNISRNVLFFSNSFGHRKVLDRVEGCIKAGFAVHLICYNKSDISKIRSGLAAVCSSINIIGSPRDGGSVFRVFNWVAAFLFYVKFVFKFGFPEIVLVNSAEFLIFSSALPWGRTRKIYDIADVHHIQYGLGFKSIVFRLMERFSLRRGWDVVVSSPWFYWGYFLGIQGVDNRAVLVENKLTSVELNSLVNSSASAVDRSEKCVIGWTGILRCNTSMKILIDLCEKYPNRFQVNLIGIVDLINPDLLLRAKNCSDFVFSGRFSPAELGGLLEPVHFVWLCDFDDGLNSEWLLPNRLYQAIASSRPCLGFEKSASGRVVMHHGIGVVFSVATVQAVFDCVNSVSDEKYFEMSSKQTLLAPNIVRSDEFKNVFLGSIFNSRRLTAAEDAAVTFL